jgi:hypothetical protein
MYCFFFSPCIFLSPIFIHEYYFCEFHREVIHNPLLPKITMVGISVGEGSVQMSKANIKKTIDNLTKELEQSSHQLEKSTEEKDPLFVANVGDYSRITKISSP